MTMLNVKQKSKVLHLRSSGGLLGAENVVLELAKGSHLFGYDPIVGALKNEEDPVPDFIDVAKKCGIKTVVFVCARSLDFQVASRIKRFIEANQVNILHCHGYKENFYGILSRTSIPKIATNHLWKISSFKSRAYAFVDMLVIRFYDSVVGVSDEIVHGMRRLGVRKSMKIANGIDCERFNISLSGKECLGKYGIKSDDFVVGMVSSLTVEKNHKSSLDAVAIINHPRLKLLIVGHGNLAETLKKRVVDKGLTQRVSFAGPLTDVTDVMSAIDVFLIPSLSEGLPMALLEAMASGKAVIASNVGDIGHVIDHNVNGLLIDKCNIDDIKSSIEFYLKNPEKMSHHGMLARRTVVDKYSCRKMIHNYCKEYLAITSSDIKK